MNPPAEEVVLRPFGAANRAALLASYFQDEEVAPAEAWKHVYRLLLWQDPTTGLAHCYESDKSQPGRPWYERTLAFHAWLAGEFGCSPRELGTQIDWLFRRATEQLSAAAAQLLAARAARVATQRARFEALDMPLPGEDLELEALIVDALGPWLTAEPPAEAMRQLSQRVRAYLGQENKRRNLLGEGFEDTLAAVMRRLPRGAGHDVRTRGVLDTLPGFRPPPSREKPRTVDLAVLTPQRRVLATVKWSIRADREEQFGVDFEAYARLEEAGEDFEFVLVTNEFDAARLNAACERRTMNRPLFDAVVHVNPAGPMAAYASEGRGAARSLPQHVDAGRIIGLSEWVASLTG